MANQYTYYPEFYCNYVLGKVYRMRKEDKEFEELGNDNGHGYLTFSLDKKKVKVHRYLYEKYHGITLNPDIELNHINRIRTDNRIDNLEISNRPHNCQNQGKQKNNTSGFKGVSYNKKNKKWKAYININGKQKHLGYFSTAELAYEAYKSKARELNQQGHNYHFDE